MINLTTSYQGKFAAQFIALAILGGKMIDKNLITRFLNIKKAMFLPVVRLNGVIKPYTSDFVAAGSIDISDRQLDPKAASVHLEFLIDTLEQMFMSEGMTAGMQNSNMDTDFESFVTKYIAREINNQIDNFIWNADKTKTGAIALVDGLLKRIAADAQSVKIPSVALTKSNVLDEIAKVYVAMPENTSEQPDMKFYTSVKTMKLYKQAVADKGLITAPLADHPMYDSNIEIVSIPGFPANTIVCAPVSNLFYGTDLESDTQSYELIDMRHTTGDRKLRLRMDFKLDVNYAFGDSCVVYA
ncbi:MAG: hypothetical protein JW735_06435 [Prolixibacteraceae bacterium]|nr:hypothetical protein [Prolixibacteraceae bacterium]